MTETLASRLNTVLNHLPSGTRSRFFILGKTKEPLPSDLRERAERKECLFSNWSYGELGTIFLLTSHADVAQSDEMVALKLGFARSLSFESLSALDLLGREMVTPQGVDHNAIRGAPLILCVNTRQPSFCLYQSLTSTSQIYYWQSGDAMFFSDTLGRLIPLVSPLELNPSAIPHHLVYRNTPGEMTYFKDIRKVRSGHMVLFGTSGLRFVQLERLDHWMLDKPITKILPAVLHDIDASAEYIIGSYVQQVENSGQDLWILLSGGVDSSLLATYVQANLPSGHALQSASYTIEAQEFETEIGYAQYAIDVLQTTHRFIPVFATDYVSLLQQQTDLTAHPVECEQDPCYLAIAKAFSGSESRFVFSGSSADTLLGFDDEKRLLQVEHFGRIPYSQYGLVALAKVLKNILPNKAFGLQETAHLIFSLSDPLSLRHPHNREGIFTNLERVQSCFDPDMLSQAVDYRLAELEIFSNSRSLRERVHLGELIHTVHFTESVRTQLYRLNNLEMVTPYLDSDFVRLTLALNPNIRYFATGRQKWLPKGLIEQRLSDGHRITQKSKRAGGFDNELRRWMKSGILRDLVHEIERPSFMTHSDFEQAKENPDWFTWNLLTLDVFQKRILKS